MTTTTPTTNDYCAHGYPDFGRLCPVCSPWPSDRLVVGRHVVLETRDGVTTIRRRARRIGGTLGGIAAALVLSISWPAPASATAGEPPVWHFGPPAGPDVVCRRATFRDRSGTVLLVLERCYRLHPVRPGGVRVSPPFPCTLERPCPVLRWPS
jgi:hypothetical protein